jgi:hypothetical protein
MIGVQQLLICAKLISCACTQVLAWNHIYGILKLKSIEIKNSLDNVEHLNLWIMRTETTSEIRLINMQYIYTEIDMRN